LSDPLAELVVEKYAEARGEDPAKARERLLPVLTARRPSRLDRAAEALASLADLLGKVREAGKDMPDQVKTPLTTLAAAAVGAALGAEDEDPVEEGVKGAAKYIAQVKAIDRAFGPDEEARTLRAEIAELRKMVAELQEARRKEEAQKLVEEIQGLIKPLEERLAALEEARKGGEQPPPQPPSAEDIIAQVNKVKGEAEKLLTGMGYRVEPGGVTKEEVQRMIEAAREEALSKLPPEELKKRLEAMGYRVEGGPITWDQVQRMVEEARKRAYEEALEDKRIEAVERTISNAFAQIAQIFQPAVSVIFGVPPAAQALAGQPAAGGQAAEGGGEASRRQAEPSQAREGTA
jgi:uncharacterized protein YqgV (UPF0045/DUF77 family)